MAHQGGGGVMAREAGNKDGSGAPLGGVEGIMAGASLTEDAELERLRREVRVFAETQIGPVVAAAEERDELPQPVISALARSGCLGRSLPVAHGGIGLGVRHFAVQQEELARVWPTAAVAATWTHLSGLLLARFGTGDQLRLLPELARGDITGAVAWTEPQGGSDAAGVVTSAERVAAGWRLQGRKRLIDNIKNAAFVIVGARTGPRGRRGISMFLVRRDDPGFRFGGAYRTLGLKGAGVGWFELDDCVVPDDRLVGGLNQGFYQMMAMTEFGRIGVAAICLGMSEACLGAAVSFLAGRTSFGQRLSENPMLLARIADMRIRIDAARLLTARAATLHDCGVRCAREAAMAKVFASELACDIANQALHLHGGIGFTTETPVERFVRDSHAFTIGEGTSEVLRLVVARGEFEDRHGSA
jgi:alkylation response protein AidB-like acyl-CoA dehydrogenase